MSTSYKIEHIKLCHKKVLHILAPKNSALKSPIPWLYYLNTEISFHKFGEAMVVFAPAPIFIWLRLGATVRYYNK